MKLRLPNGSRPPSSLAESYNSLDPDDFLFQVNVKDEFDISTTRSSGGPTPVVEIDETDLLEVTLVDGSRWFLGAAEREELKSLNSTRSGSYDGDVLTLGSSLVSSGSSRGVSDYLMKKLRVLALGAIADSSLVDTVKELVKDASPAQILLSSIDPAAFCIARKLENKLATKGETKLCRVVLNEESNVQLEPFDAETDTEAFSSEGPTLILLHGTLSSTHGSFSGLWVDNPRIFQQLDTFYNHRILALEHCTLTESPIDNAKALADALPESANIHLLSHSRGGLIGELICRAERENDPFGSDEIRHYKELLAQQSNNVNLGTKAVKALKRYHEKEHVGLVALHDVLASKSIKVERFVRVACPARGTTLASGKLHRWSNRSLNAIGLISGMTTNPIYRAFETFTLGIVKSTSSPIVLPGLHAMMPDSALIHLLNDSFVQSDDIDSQSTQSLVHADLSVLEGDVEIGGFNWKRVPLWLSDQFYGGEHDLVVNTASMDGGAQRAGGINVFRIGGADVNHFSYFKNKKSASQIACQLLAKDNSKFLLAKQKTDVYIARGRRIRNTGDRPVLFVIPGISGSKLSVDGDRIWLNPLRILFGGLSRLEINEPNVEATDLFNLAYGKFVTEFNTDHDIYCYPYDWRLSLKEAAAELASQIEAVIKPSTAEATNQPLRIVAHSMGGLVARYLFASRPDLWEYMMTVTGSRFIMAGTPNNGSYAINYLLAGEDKLARIIAKLDQVNDIQAIVSQLAEYPGVATLLPGFGSLDWMEPEAWSDLKTAHISNRFAYVSDDLLRTARDERRIVLSSPLDNSVVAYVAGHAEETIHDAVIESGQPNNQLVFRVTAAGDGRVTWKDGIPDGLEKIWYQQTSHGSLLADEEHFDAWRDILTTGSTSRLSGIAPSITSRGFSESGARDRILPPSDFDYPSDIDYLPSEETTEQMILEIDDAPPTELKKTEISVVVSHGDLAFSSFPTVVGHFKDDSIVHAERALDQFLDFKLSERQRLGQYPGELDTSEVLFRKGQRETPEGALIVGLGKVGELTIPRLERTLKQGVVKYILTFNEWWVENRNVEDDMSSTGLSFLLLGTGIGGLSVEESVQVIVNSVCGANEEFETNNSQNYKLIKQVEIIELYQDLAVEAAHAILPFNKLSNQVSAATDLRELTGRRRRTLVSSNPDRWMTLSVNKIPGKEEYKFESLHQKARSEIIDETVEKRLVDEYLALIMDQTGFNIESPTSANKTLFEILFPNHIKNISPDTDKIKFSLDEETARIPWELLVDPWSANLRPLAVEKRVIRQLSVEQFRSRPELARTNTALVVGDPPSGDDRYPLLEGAREEASTIAAMLVSRQYKVDSVIRNNETKNQGFDMARRIIDALTTTEFKILHLAGHGSYYRGGAETQEELHDQGMIIGNGIRLRPAMIKKMRRVPQVVFMNCCHLGNIEPSAQEMRTRIAANLATQFIRNGALVVVAAAWEVIDDQAQMFAEVFYENLLANETLSDSIYRARCRVYEQYPNTNTFGAYQCWGDPMYRLDPSKNTRSQRFSKIDYVSPDECIDAALNIRMKAKSSIVNNRLKLRQECEELLEFISLRYVDLTVPEPIVTEWNPHITRAIAELGRSFGELSVFQKAIFLLRAALTLDGDHVLNKEIEQLGNFECRLASKAYVARKHSGPEVDFAPLTDSESQLLNSGIDRLEELLKLKLSRRNGASAQELFNILGSAMKRKATCQINNKAAIINTLEMMQNYYGQAWSGDTTLPKSIGLEGYLVAAQTRDVKADNYSFTNLTLATLVLRWFRHPNSGDLNITPYSPGFISVFTQYAIESAEKQFKYKDFWESTQFAIVLILLLLDEDLRIAVRLYLDRSEIIEMFENSCNDVITRPGSVRQWASVFDDLYFIEEMLLKRPGIPDAVNEDMGKIRAIANAVSVQLGSEEKATG